MLSDGLVGDSEGLDSNRRPSLGSLLLRLRLRRVGLSIILPFLIISSRTCSKLLNS